MQLKPYSSQPSSTYRSEQGVALVLVLWVLVLLSIISLHLSVNSRTEAKLASNLVYGAQIRHATDAGVRWALWNLTKPLDQRWLADGGVHEMLLEDAEVKVALYDEYGKIDINYATADRLIALFETVDIPDEESRYLVDAIIDWRDSDQLRRLNGAEDEDYEAAGYDYGAKDALFESVSELLDVLGMTPEVFYKIESALTVYSKKSGVNPLVASRLVLLTLPGATPELVDQYIDDRRSNHDEGLPPPETPPFGGQLLPQTLQSVYYTIRTQAEIPDKAESRTSVVIRNRGITQRMRFETVNRTVQRSSISAD